MYFVNKTKKQKEKEGLYKLKNFCLTEHKNKNKRKKHAIKKQIKTLSKK